MERQERMQFANNVVVATTTFAESARRVFSKGGPPLLFEI